MSLKDALAGIREAQEPTPAPAATKAAKSPLAPRPSVVRPIAPPALPGKTGKSSDPEFEQVKIFIRRATHKAARRRWEDEERGDFSDLMQELLTKYLSE